MDFRTKLQLDEALGPVNQWFCSIYYGREITDKEVLVAYYIRHGGAADFAMRWAQAMGRDNRWYCSEFHRQDIREPRALWEYYMTHAFDRARENAARDDGNYSHRNIAC